MEALDSKSCEVFEENGAMTILGEWLIIDSYTYPDGYTLIKLLVLTTRTIQRWYFEPLYFVCYYFWSVYFQDYIIMHQAEAVH